MSFKKNLEKKFIIQQFSSDALTVSTDVFVPPHLRTVIDLRINRLAQSLLIQKNLAFRPQIINLSDFGFDYFDFGYHSDWIAAEIPINAIKSEDSLKKAGEIILQISSQILSLA